MGSRTFAASAVCATAAVILLCSPLTRAQGRRTVTMLAPEGLTELRAYDARVEQMLRSGDLRIRSQREDELVPGRRIERADQYLSLIHI